MSLRGTKRKSFTSIDMRETTTTSGKDEEKTIPFLKRLTDMLKENDEVISFYPGNRVDGSLGKIVVHDRARVESEVLPQYFNHASFASLRRQLNYFSFTRIGKGRQRGATYINEFVVDLEDILRLKRRSAGSASSAATTSVSAVVSNNGSGDDATAARDKDNSSSSSDGDGTTATNHPIVRSVVPVVHLPPKKKRASAQWKLQNQELQQSQPQEAPRSKKPRTTNLPKAQTATLISPASASPTHSSTTSTDGIYLDLTRPSSKKSSSSSSKRPPSLKKTATTMDMFVHKDDDILFGCNALLSFTNRAF